MRQRENDSPTVLPRASAVNIHLGASVETSLVVAHKLTTGPTQVVCAIMQARGSARAILSVRLSRRLPVRYV